MLKTRISEYLPEASTAGWVLTLTAVRVSAPGTGTGSILSLLIIGAITVTVFELQNNERLSKAKAKQLMCQWDTDLGRWTLRNVVRMYMLSIVWMCVALGILGIILMPVRNMFITLILYVLICTFAYFLLQYYTLWSTIFRYFVSFQSY